MYYPNSRTCIFTSTFMHLNVRFPATNIVDNLFMLPRPASFGVKGVQQAEKEEPSQIQGQPRRGHIGPGMPGQTGVGKSPKKLGDFWTSNFCRGHIPKFVG